MTVLLLDAGFGHDNGHTVSLRCEPGQVHEALEDTLLGYSCYPPSLPRIRACLEASGRYDCTLQTIWFEGQAKQLRRCLSEIGINIGVINVCRYGRAKEKWLPDDMNWIEN